MSNISDFFGISGGASPWNTPQLPAPLVSGGYIRSDGPNVPHSGTLIDNVEFPEIVGSGSFIGRLAESTVWTVAFSDVNANVDNWLGAGAIGWYDSVNDRFWAWGYDSTTAPDTLYTFYITLETGVVTNVGNTPFAVDPADRALNSGVSVFRSAEDTGNFTLTFSDRTIVINESTGAFVSDVAATNTSNGEKAGTYVTADGLITSGVVTVPTTANGSSINITKGQQTAVISLPDGLGLGAVGTSTTALRWGGEVRIISSGGTTSNYKAFKLTEWDAHLLAMSKNGGLT